MEKAELNENGVVIQGNAVSFGQRLSFKIGDKSLNLVGLGLENIVAVATRDAVLVADKRRVQKLKTY